MNEIQDIYSRHVALLAEMDRKDPYALGAMSVLDDLRRLLTASRPKTPQTTYKAPSVPQEPTSQAEEAPASQAEAAQASSPKPKRRWKSPKGV